MSPNMASYSNRRWSRSVTLRGDESSTGMCRVCCVILIEELRTTSDWSVGVKGTIGRPPLI